MILTLPNAILEMIAKGEPLASTMTRIGPLPKEPFKCRAISLSQSHAFSSLAT